MQTTRPDSVIGPLGEVLTHAKLPPAGIRRWVIRRKAEVVAALDGNMLTIDEACTRYDISIEELATWRRLVERAGMQGLRVTKAQHYRDLHERQMRY